MGLTASFVAGFGLARAVTDPAREANREVRRARRLAEADAARLNARLAAEEAKDPPTLPDPKEETRKGRRRSIVAQARRRGRQSTILTSPDTGTLG